MLPTGKGVRVLLKAQEVESIVRASHWELGGHNMIRSRRGYGHRIVEGGAMPKI